jgi:hypothetical protein
VLQWTKTVGGGDFDYGYSIIQTSDGGFALSGSTASFGAGGYDAYFVKLDSNGSLQWTRTAGGVNDENVLSIKQTSDGGYVGAGSTSSFGSGNADFFIVKLDSSGNTCGNSSSPSPAAGSGGTLGNPAFTTTSPTPTVTSPISSTGTGGEVTAICLIGIQPISNEIPRYYELHQNFPNPFNPVTKIKFDVPNFAWAQYTEPVQLLIYDILGRKVISLVSELLKPGTYEVDWDASRYPSGVYFCKLTSGNFSETKKMVLAK